ncbi:MAG: serine/threonine protein kinase, partial [Anaerolineae bacterium]|nr:serine/threonine protein kinase [Anaerolineae bacterium]
MGAVYRGYQASLRREVAVKVISLRLASRDDVIQRFNREAHTAASLEHAHIVPIIDFGTEEGISYIVMRLLTGGSLEERIHRRSEQDEPPMPLPDIVRLINQIASGLEYAHRHGVIHRDIKTSNIMFDDAGNAYLVDFGIAKMLDTTSNLTGTGSTLGTPLFMAPEQWRGEEVTAATDQYALAVMAYLLVTGQMPFDAPTPYALLHMHLHDTPTSPLVLRKGLPIEIEYVIQRAMSKNPQDRFATVMDFGRAFEQATHSAEGVQAESNPDNTATMIVETTPDV